MGATRLLIAGGGIGGLATALCAAARGIEVEVFEQATQLTEVGAGIQLSPNCTRVLHHLGLEAALRDCAFLPQATQFLDWRSGRVISENPLGAQVIERYGVPYYHIHRGDLLNVLIEACNQESKVKLHTGTEIAKFSQDNNGVRLMTSSQTFRGDALVGADGIHSTIRAQLWGAEQPTFTGNIAWRALVPTAALPEGLVRPNSTVWWGPKRHFVHYYVRGGDFVNCVCVVEKKGWQKESWTEPGELEELKSEFDGWHSNIQQLIDNMEPASLYKWALFDREPMSAWGQGRVTLLGDACHPTLPFMAQGAAMAIEDAAVLSSCLGETMSVESAFSRYEGLRRSRTASIQRGSRRNARVFHLSGVKAWMRNRVAGKAGGRTLDHLFSYDALNVIGKADGD